MSTKLSKKIKELKESGLSYRKIQEELGCSKGTISYHLGSGQKEKANKRKINNRTLLHPFSRKLETFKSHYTKPKTRKELHEWKKLLKLKIESFFRDRKTMKNNTETFTVEDIIKKFGENPRCYLTDDEIDIYKPRTYHFDHIVPVSKGGENSIDNLGICTKEANMAKYDMTLEELLEFCKKVLKKHS